MRDPRVNTEHVVRPADIETVAVIEVGADGLITWVSRPIVEITGHAAGDLIGQPLVDLVPERMRAAHVEAFGRFIARRRSGLDGGPLTLPALHADGFERDIRLVLFGRYDGEDPSVVGLITSTLATASHDADQVIERVRLRLQQLIAADRPVREVLGAALEPVVSSTGWSLGVLWSFDPWVERLTAIQTWERDPGAHPAYLEATRRARFVIGEGFSTDLWQLLEPWWSDHLPDEPRFVRAATARRDGVTSGVFVPIVNGTRMIGIVELVDDEVRTVDAEMVAGLQAIAAELGRHLAERLRRETEAIQRERLELALAGGRLGLWTLHPESGQVTWDAMVEHAHGIAPGSFGGTFESFVSAIHADDREVALDAVRPAIDEVRRFDIAYRAIADDGSIRFVEGSGAPLVDVDGKLQLMIGVAQDVTSEVLDRELLRRRASSAALAADVGRALVGDAPIEHRLDQVVNAIVDHLDVALARLWILPAGADELELVASAGLYTHLDGAHGRIKVGQWKIGRLAESGQQHVTNDVAHDPQISDPDWAEREGIRAFAGYPLTAQDRCVGVLGVFARHELTDDVVGSLGSLTDSLAVALVQDAERRRVRELLAEAQQQRELAETHLRDRQRVAAILQESLLPPDLPDIDGFDSAAAYRAGVEVVGGDFYDLFPLSEQRWGFMIGDVCGRGPEAARFTALARHTLRTTLLLGNDPAQALLLLDQALTATETDGRFCTAVCGVIRTDLTDASISLAVAGHPPPLVVRADGAVDEIEVGGPLLGVRPDAQFDLTDIDLRPGDALLLYTDGVTEARSASGWFGADRLRQHASEHAGRSAADLVEGVLSKVNEFDDLQTRDDIALLAVRRS